MTTTVAKSSSKSIKNNHLSFWLDTSVSCFKVLLEIEPFDKSYPPNREDYRVNWNINKEGTFTLFKVDSSNKNCLKPFDRNSCQEVIKVKGGIADLPQYSSYPKVINTYIADYIFTDKLMIN